MLNGLEPIQHNSSSLQLIAACAYPAAQLQSKVPGVGYPSRCPEHAHAQGVCQFSQHYLASLQSSSHVADMFFRRLFASCFGGREVEGGTAGHWDARSAGET